MLGAQANSRTSSVDREDLVTRAMRMIIALFCCSFLATLSLFVSAPGAQTQGLKPQRGRIGSSSSMQTARSNHPSSAMAGNPSPVSQQVATERQALSNQSIRSVDFADFTFPQLGELRNSGKTFTLRSGELKPTRDKNSIVEEMGVTLQSIAYGDVTGDGGEEAMVVLSMVTGGSAIPHATYIYASEDGKPKLLWAFSTGDRAEGGLRRVFAEKGELVIEQYSPVNSKGDCCPTLFTRARYKWKDKHFEQGGKEEVLPNSEGHGSPLMEAYRSSS